MKKSLSIFLLLIGLSAVMGGYRLIFNNGLGMPIESLHGVFPSYLIPGFILLFILGGAHILAAIMLWRNSRFAMEFAATAGFSLIIWLFSELYIMREPHWLQILYFVFALITLISVMISLKWSDNGIIKPKDY